MTTEPTKSRQLGPKLAWFSLLCGVLAWLLASVLPAGPDIAAIILGARALGQTSKDDKKTRIIAHMGLWSGALKLLTMLLTAAWALISFILKQVAH